MSLRALLIAALVGLAGADRAAASVFTNSVFLTNLGNTGPGGLPAYDLSTWSQPNGTGNGASIEMVISNGLALRPYDFTVGIGERWFSVTNGTLFNAAALATATPFANNLGAPFTPGNIQLSVGTNFFLAFRLDESPTSRYGWVKLQYTASGLILLGNAIEDSGSGIIVGTMTVVPEPSSFLLTALASGLLLGGWHSRRQSRPSSSS